MTAYRVTDRAARLAMTRGVVTAQWRGGTIGKHITLGPIEEAAPIASRVVAEAWAAHWRAMEGRQPDDAGIAVEAVE